MPQKIAEGMNYVVIEGKTLWVNTDTATRLVSFRTPDGRLFRVAGWFDTAPRRIKSFVEITATELWQSLPTLEIKDPERIRVPDYVVKWQGVEYRAEILPWSVARLVNPSLKEDVVLHITWVKDPVEWYKPTKVERISRDEFLKLIPTARPSEQV